MVAWEVSAHWGVEIASDVYVLFLVNVKLRSQMINRLLVYGEDIRKQGEWFQPVSKLDKVKPKLPVLDIILLV